MSISTMSNSVRLYRGVLMIIGATMLTACSSVDEQQVAETLVEQPAALGNVEYHTHVLAQELFARLPLNKHYRYAVASFVPVTTLEYNPRHQHPLMLLGHQLEQGLMTEAHRRGFITQEYKLSNDIVLKQEGESVLSRKIEDLNGDVNVDFYISGTITEQQEGAIVNARVIHAHTRDVVAAATKFFPAELFWQREKITSRNGMIYRTGS